MYSLLDLYKAQNFTFYFLKIIFDSVIDIMNVKMWEFWNLLLFSISNVSFLFFFLEGN